MPVPSGHPPLVERRLRLGGRRLRLLRGGEGNPIVLCHGFLGSAENFDGWLGTLAPRRTLVIPDLPGCGESEPLEGAHTCAAIAASLEPLLDELGLETFDLAGLCLGAPVACALARRRPAAVQRLLLHTPLLSPAHVRARFHAQVRLMTAPGVFPAVSWLSRRRLVSDVYKRLIVEGADVDAGAAEVNFRNQLRADPRAMREWLRDGLGCDDIGLLTARERPTLLVVAADDRIVDVPRLRRLVDRSPHLDAFVDAGAGHGWTEAAVQRQIAVIAAFLDAALPTRRPAA